MKKSFFLIKLLIFCISCDETNDLVGANDECDDSVCTNIINDFTIKLSGSMIPFGNYTMEAIYDNENYFGVSYLATNEYDKKFDIFEPPSSAGNWISIFFPHSEWNQELGNNFTQDIRYSIITNDENKIEWIFHVQSNIYGLVNFDIEMENNLCDYCLKSFEFIVDGESFFYQNDNFLNQSFFIESNNLMLCKIILEFI